MRMKVFLMVCLSALSLTSARANLGDTEQQIIGHYGREVFRSDLPARGLSIVRLSFRKGDLAYDVILYKGRSADETIFHPTFAPLTSEEIATLLDNSSQGEQWHEAVVNEDIKIVKPTASWQREGAIAHVDERKGQPRFLFHVESRDLAQALLVAEDSAQ